MTITTFANLKIFDENYDIWTAIYNPIIITLLNKTTFVLKLKSKVKLVLQWKLQTMFMKHFSHKNQLKPIAD